MHRRLPANEIEMTTMINREEIRQAALDAQFGLVGDCQWASHDVPVGVVITAHSIHGFQNVQWMCHSGRFGYISGYFN